MSQATLCTLKVSGEFACFTRPELKVERVSYLAPTPSAVRGIFEAILFKPQFRWHPREVRVLRPIQFIPLRRNEVQGKISSQLVKRAIKAGGLPQPLFADDMENEGEGRTQRQTLALQNVAYVLSAEIRLTPAAQLPQDTVVKYREQFIRRVEKGQCFHQPSLGCREFAASFEPADGSEVPISETRDLGLMVFDIFDLEGPTTRIEDEQQLESARRLSVFQALMVSGVITFPDWGSKSVIKTPKVETPTKRGGRRKPE